jgi:D-alanyl-D-alanine endopeptidase (penicillin-binding protein 7)
LEFEEPISKAPLVEERNSKPQKKAGIKELDLSWGSVLAYDINSQEKLYAREADKQRPIASISKLATALVLLDQDMDWESVYEMKASDRVEGGRIYVYENEKIKLKDLLYTSLLASDNTATKALVSASGLSYEDFVKAMNAKAESLGLVKTKFVDPIGLSSLNVSTAFELAKLAEVATANGVIRDCLLKDKYIYQTEAGVSKTIKSTNILLDNFQTGRVKILGGKTGYTAAAGYCFVALFEGDMNNKVITVVLGSENHNSRFTNTERLANWVYGAYEWGQ